MNAAVITQCPRPPSEGRQCRTLRCAAERFEGSLPASPSREPQRPSMQCVPWTQGSRSDTKQITDRQMSVRPNWLRRRLVPAETDLNQWLSTARPEAVTAWQALDSHLKVVAAIGHITAEFDCRTAPFRMITEFTLGRQFQARRPGRHGHRRADRGRLGPVPSPWHSPADTHNPLVMVQVIVASPSKYAGHDVSALLTTAHGTRSRRCCGRSVGDGSAPPPQEVAKRGHLLSFAERCGHPSWRGLRDRRCQTSSTWSCPKPLDGVRAGGCKCLD
jgi:hypothetical protein